jgi:hypothetical protein
MSEAMPMSIQPPPPSAEQLTAWQALIKRALRHEAWGGALLRVT